MPDREQAIQAVLPFVSSMSTDPFWAETMKRQSRERASAIVDAVLALPDPERDRLLAYKRELDSDEPHLCPLSRALEAEAERDRLLAVDAAAREVVDAIDSAIAGPKLLKALSRLRAALSEIEPRPRVEITDEMVERAHRVWLDFTRSADARPIDSDAMRAALDAALNPNPEER